MEMLAEETKKREVVVGEEVDRMEAKWEAKLEDTNEEIAIVPNPNPNQHGVTNQVQHPCTGTPDDCF